ncbi:hypothetical protein HPG69_007370 [Diceros bicornis minor]|uniref:Uncharacterized protein n=1 Tax=Diceros bicornis minor TaxID=77932 RepID=A0A7J7EKJ2_DICBM|nr:hypothetical protein HPG69_007370 [Diceros bicornis minor]
MSKAHPPELKKFMDKKLSLKLNGDRCKRSIICRNPEHFFNVFGFSQEDQDLWGNFDQVFEELFHSSDKVVSIFHANTIDYFFLNLQHFLDSHLLPSKMLCMGETRTFKNVDCLTLFESCATKSAGGLESQTCQCIVNVKRTEF